MRTALAPRTLAEAVSALATDPELTPLAGCTDLMVQEAARSGTVGGVLDLSGIAELRGVTESREGLEIGAGTTFTEIRGSAAVLRHAPALARAAASIGGWQIQNRATLGGNVVNASPAGDSLPVLLALSARVLVAGPGGERAIEYSDFHVGYRETALRPGELVRAFHLPAQAEGSRQLFRKVGTRLAQAISKVVVALVSRVEDGRVAELRLAAGSVAPVPVLFGAIGQEALGRPATKETATWLGWQAAAQVTPIDDVRSTAEYRRFALERVVRRLALEGFASDAGSGLSPSS